VRLSNGKRVKWEPAALMVIVLGLGLWIGFGPASKPHLPTRDGALKQELRIGDQRGVLEASPAGNGDFRFRVLMRDSVSPEFDRAEAERRFGKRVVATTIAPRSNWVFRRLSITSWVGVVWLSIGLFGQVLFSGRMILQWITSEKRRQSVITESFWWFSLFGSLLLFSYFVWRQEPVGMLGQASGIVIYARNLRLIYKHKRRARRQQPAPNAGPRAEEPEPVGQVAV
jgi:lipid-A-disaccharide synthase-like uncharacterized protein